jgi:predicted transcriptional regulator
MITISTRLDEKILKEIDNLAQELNLDKSALIRKFILDGFQNAILRKNIELIKIGELSIEQAAIIAQVPICRVLEVAREMDIEIGSDSSTMDYETAVLKKSLSSSSTHEARKSRL